MQHPAARCVRPVLDGFTDELEPETVAAVLLEDVHIREIDEACGVAIDNARKADLVRAVVEADGPRTAVDQRVLPGTGAALGPVRLREERMDCGAVDASRIVVQLVAVFEGALHGNDQPMSQREVHVDEVKAFKTQSGNTRFVLRADDGSEYTTFKEPIARQAIAAEGKRARIEFHEQERNGFTNVYLDKVEPLDDDGGADDDGESVDEAAWKTAVDAAPWLLGEAPEGGVDPDEAFEKLQPFKERVADDIRDDGED